MDPRLLQGKGVSGRAEPLLSPSLSFPSLTAAPGAVPGLSIPRRVLRGAAEGMCLPGLGPCSHVAAQWPCPWVQQPMGCWMLGSVLPGTGTLLFQWILHESPNIRSHLVLEENFAFALMGAERKVSTGAWGTQNPAPTALRCAFISLLKSRMPGNAPASWSSHDGSCMGMGRH